MPLLGGIYLYGAIGDHPKAADFALQGIKVFVVSGVFVQGIKQITHRHRPHQDVPPDPRNWDGPFSDIQYTSFPSAHTTAAFATACFLSEYFKEKKWVPWLSYTLAAGVGLSRINDDEHWASDVFAGAILGYYMARFLMRNKNTSLGLQVLPGGHAGFSLQYHL
ncbi:MAG: phosphatase PAP2 family protein [Bacteroidota bacterium]|nr:phosphatase PAP2 family protein [Bacteroidota bacterium]